MACVISWLMSSLVILVTSMLDDLAFDDLVFEALVGLDWPLPDPDPVAIFDSDGGVSVCLK